VNAPARTALYTPPLHDALPISLSTAWGGRYVNDFINRGRVKRVYVQGDAPYRAQPSNIDQWFVRTRTGEMAPFSSFARTSWATRSEEHTSELQSRGHLVCRLLL